MKTFTIKASEYRWLNGDCGTYAIALKMLRPSLRNGELGDILDDGGADFEFSGSHFFAHDDRWAYDALGRHPLPYFGLTTADYCMLDIDLEDFWMVSGQGALIAAFEHIGNSGLVAPLTVAKVALAPAWTVMSPKGWTGPTYYAMTGEAAEKAAEKEGYAIADIMTSAEGNILVVEDEASYDLA